MLSESRLLGSLREKHEEIDQLHLGLAVSCALTTALSKRAPDDPSFPECGIPQTLATELYFYARVLQSAE